MNLLSADEYCRHKTAPPGSSFYYSILFYPERLRRDLRALHAFGIELEEILTECSDAGVMRMKLAWWQDEIARLYQHAARHPVSLALENVLSRHDIQQHQLSQVVSKIEQLAVMSQPLPWESLLMQLADGPGLVWQLAAELCGYQEAETITLAVDMGSLFAWFQTLQKPPLAGPVIALQTNSLDRPMHIRRIQERLEHHCTIFPMADRHRQLHIFIMGHIISRTCQEILRKNQQGQRPALTPLRKLWMAWRLYRRYR